jgi:hypothetical protein
MKDKNEKIIGTREKDDALLNFVNYQAQEAILNPNLPDSTKDEVLEAAVGTIQKVAERKAVYYAKYGEGRRTRNPHIIYEAPNDESKEQENIPPIIMALNEHLKMDTREGMRDFTVEWLAERVGISKNILYEWTENDTEFTTALERLKNVQENDPFKTGTEEDTFVNSMMIALVLMETRERHFKSDNQ